MQKNTFFEKRRQARQFSLQALYQWEMVKNDISVIEKQFQALENFPQCDADYFSEIIHGVINHIDIINGFMNRYINRPLTEIDIVELSICRIATFELLEKKDVPPRVILNEALELTKLFGATDGHKFVNGVCDKIAREIRHLEINK